MKVALLPLLAAAACGPEWRVSATFDRVVLSVDAPSREAAFAVGGDVGSGGDGLFLRRQGDSWVKVPTGGTATLWWTHAFSASDVWTVGELGLVGHFDGTQLTYETPLTGQTLYGIWGTGPDDLWAVGGTPGQGGVLLRRDASGWRVEPSPVPFVAYFKVWGAASNDVFVCGEAGTVLHWDGAQWTQQASGVSQAVTLFTVAGRSGSEVYAVGGFGRGVVITYDGSSWKPLADAALDNAGGLNGVSVDASDGTLLIVGTNGAKLRGRPGSLVDDTLLAPREDFHGAYLGHGQMFAVGGSYLAPAGAKRTGTIATR